MTEMSKSLLIVLCILNVMFSATFFGWIILGHHTDIFTWVMAIACLGATGLGIREIRKAKK